MLLLLVLGMVEVLVVLEVLEVLVVLVESIFERVPYFLQKCHGPTSPGLWSLWGLWL